MAHHGRRRDTPLPGPRSHPRPFRRHASPPSSDTDCTDDERDAPGRAALGPPLPSVHEHGFAHPDALATLEGRRWVPNPRDSAVLRAAHTGAWAGLGVGRMPRSWAEFEAAHHRDLAHRPLRSAAQLERDDVCSSSAPPRSPRARGDRAHEPLTSAFSFSSSEPGSPTQQVGPSGTSWYSSGDDGDAWSDGEATASPRREFRLPSIQPGSPLLLNFPPSPRRVQVFREGRRSRARSFNTQEHVPMNLDAMVSDSSPERTRTDAPSRRRASSLSLPLSLLSIYRELEADVLCMQGTTDEVAALKLALARASSDFDLPKPILPLSLFLAPSAALPHVPSPTVPRLASLIVPTIVSKKL